MLRNKQNDIDMNSNKNIPQLRFPEFTGEWEEKVMSDVFTRRTEKNAEDNKNVLTISAQYGLISQLEFFKKSVSAADVTGYYLLHKGDFAYNKSSSQGKPVGAIKPLKLYEKGVVSTLYIVFRCKDPNAIGFWEQYFDAGIFDNEIMSIAQEGARNHGLLNVPTNDFFGLDVLSPSPAEQQKIAECLSEIDNLITAQGEKVDTLKEKKKGMMQQMFPQQGETTPRLRFPGFTGDWNGVEFGSIITEYIDKTTTENEDILLSSAIDGLYLNSELFTHFRGQSNIGYRKVKRNMLILSAQNLHLGNANVNLRFETGIISPAYKVYYIHNCDPVFLSHWIKREEAKTFFENATTAGASVCRKNIVWKELYKQIIYLPTDCSEQQKIAECLSAMDDMIASESAKLDALKDHKKGLMQQLFPQPNK